MKRKSLLLKEKIKNRLKKVFTESQAEELADILMEVYPEHEIAEMKEAITNLGKDVRELTKSVAILSEKIKELAEAQKRTEKRVEELAEAQKRSEERIEELAEAQKRSEERIEELAEAQKRSEERIEELAEAQKRSEERIEELAEGQARMQEAITRLAIGLDELRKQVGGISHALGYALENEAFRMLPGILKEKYGITIKKKFIRKEIDGYEINIFGIGTKDGKEVLIIGEAEVKISGKPKPGRGIFKDLEKKTSIIKRHYPGKEIVKVIVTHFAGNAVIKEARKQGIILIQSFEW